MTDTCKIDGCQMEETGICAMHGIEVERRENMKENVDKIPSILTRMNIMFGTMGVWSLIIVAAFLYTRDTKQELRFDTADLRQDLLETSKNINELAVITGEQGTLQSILLSETKDLNVSLRKLVDKQVAHEQKVNEQLYDAWGTTRRKE